MTLVRWTPIKEMVAAQDQMDKVLSVFGREWPTLRESGLYPPVDVVETDDAYVVRADLPGTKLEDIKVHLANNVLTIKGEKHVEKREEKGNYLHTEREYGAFERSFTLGAPIAPDRITAVYTNGVLSITLLKSEQHKMREIKVEAATTA